MEIAVRIQGHTLIAELVGELDHHSAKEVKDMVEQGIKSGGVRHLVFDFSRLSFMDSSGIGVVVGRFKLISSLGGQVAICGANRTVDRLLTMSGIKKLIPAYPTAVSALQHFQEEIS